MTGVFGMSFVFGKALTDADRKKLVFEIMATRIAAGAVRGSKDSLKTSVSALSLQAAYTRLQTNKTFNKLLDDPKHLEAMCKSLTGGRTHGGSVEAYVQKVTAFGQAQTGLPLQKQLDEIKKEKAEIQNQNDVQKQGNGFGIN